MTSYESAYEEGKEQERARVVRILKKIRRSYGRPCGQSSSVLVRQEAARQAIQKVLDEVEEK